MSSEFRVLSSESRVQSPEIRYKAKPAINCANGFFLWTLDSTRWTEIARSER